MTTTTFTGRRQVLQLVEETVGEYVTDLQGGYLRDKPAAVAILAQLRRGAGKLPEDMPGLWGLGWAERIHQDDGLTEAEAEKAERAVFLAITLYALHQQSRSQMGMHRSGSQLGEAVRRLMPGAEIDEPIRRRFVQLGTASTFEVLADRLRGIVSLLRGDSIPLDYALLARQLYLTQSPDGVHEVRRSWGRSFHAFRPQAAKPDASPDGGAATDKEVS